jgi:hypothetical protein
MEQITLELPTDLAQKFSAASAMDKNIITAFITSWLNGNTDEKRRIKAKHRLLKTMNDIGQKAAERGMTQEIFDDILKTE